MRIKRITAGLLLMFMLLLGGCGGEPAPTATLDPYAGMVQVDSGYGTQIWVKDYEDVPVSTFEAAQFRDGGAFLRYTGSDYAALRGIDVSQHQENIDWAAVASDGVDFAMIRAGYRGYSEGGLYEDDYFRKNMDEASAQGIKLGVYFFSQAVNEEEAIEEANYLLGLIGDYKIDLPVMFDWESIENDEARTDDVSGEQLTKNAVAFCETISKAGYSAGVYAYRYLAYFYYDLSLIKPYELWIGAIGDSPDFYYAHDIWQYTDSGTVSGINGAVDMNLMFVPTAKAQQDSDAAQTPEGQAETKPQAEAAAAQG